MIAVSPAQTLLVHRSYVDTGLHITRAISDYMARRSIPDLLNAIKRRIESGGTWRKR
jgi:hypothetical protein